MFCQGFGLFFLFYMISFLCVVGCDDWIFVWLGLEINMISFIVIMVSKVSIEVEACIKYFLIQGVGSALLLASIYSSYSEDYTRSLMIMILMYKVGGGVFYFWFPGVCDMLSWFSMFMLMSLQKILPLFLMSLLVNMTLWFNSVISLLVGVGGSFNQIKFKRLLAYSSIHHLGWLFLSIYLDMGLWVMYLLMYFILLMSVIYLMVEYSLINMLMLKDVNISISMVVGMLSMGGMPPFLGFYLKWMIFYYLVDKDFSMMIFLVVMSVFMLYIYLRVVYLMMLGKVSIKVYFESVNLGYNSYDLLIIFGGVFGGGVFLWFF